jgi:hypothetical protein
LLYFKYFQVKVASIAPKVGAVKYTHKLLRLPATKAGAKERAGFIDAPEIGPANIASNNTTPPTAMAVYWLTDGSS